MAITSVVPAIGGSQGGVAGITINVDSGATGKTHSDCLFGGVACPAAGFSTPDDFTISCETPAHAAGVVDVTVTGIGTLASGFKYDSFNWSEVNNGYGGSLANSFRDSIYVAGKGMVFVGDGGLVLTSNVSISTWTQRTLPAPSNQALRGVAYSPTLGTSGRLVVVGANGFIAYSDDFGATWTAATAVHAALLSSVVWAPWMNSGSGRFIACHNTAVASQFEYSNDGITWVGVAAPVSKAWLGLAASTSLQLVIAVASNAAAVDNIASTPDATNWTSRTNVAYASITVPFGGRWVLADTQFGFAFPCSVGGNPVIQYSANGTSGWTASPSVGATGPERYQFLTSPNIMFTVGPSSQTIRSTDLVTFTRDDMPFPPLSTLSPGTLRAHCWANDLSLLVVAQTGAANVMLYGLYVSAAVPINVEAGDDQTIVLSDVAHLSGSYLT